jgi:ABC-type amino acid transport substrate-binding protein
MDLIKCWRRTSIAISAAALLSTLASTATLAQPITPPGGQLKCDVSGGVSYFVGSSRALDCVYTPNGFPPEFYRGSINKIGIDVGFQRRGVIVWAVLSPGLTNGPGSLSGNYVGLSADVAAGLGAGANALIGGNKIVLQPVSVSGNIGINIAAGVGDITLTYVGGAVPAIREWVPLPIPPQ